MNQTTPGNPGPGRADFTPDTLDRTFVSLELIDKIRASGETDLLDVIVDLNLEYPDGRDEARKWIEQWFDALKAAPAAAPQPGAVAQPPAAPPPPGAAGPTPPPAPAASAPYPNESINKAKSLYSHQYVFAKLTPRGIRALVVDIKARLAQGQRSPVYKIWLDHTLKHFANVSARTVKADAARAAFGADGRDIVWAVADSGVDASHPHFDRHANLDDLPPGLKHRDFTFDGEPSDAQLVEAARTDAFGHGTHVAGIIAGEIGGLAADRLSTDAPDGADKLSTKTAPAIAFRRERDESDNVSTDVIPLSKIAGMAPCTKLLSLKVLDENGEGKSSNLIAALEYIQHLNGDGRMVRVHGVNISVGYSYKPEWFACGQSPLCVEIDRLVRSGVCVVVAAGNDGYGYVNSANAAAAAAGLDVTIADPGNADLAITVGSTHRESPHTYGVSYFSSKGPTGDGRLKPDLLAPGEKILSCMSAQMRENPPEQARLSKTAIAEAVARARDKVAVYREESGTSMAAPHVSGVVAAFLSTRREFIGRPQDVKEILLSTATDLKRAVYFQGKGLVDLMRAIQSV